MSAQPAQASSLRARLLRALFVACAVPLGLMVLVEVTLFARFERQSAQDRTDAVARRVARETAAYVTEHRLALETLANLLGHHPLEPPRAEEALQRFRERYPGFLTLLVASQDGAVMAASPATDAQGVRHASQGRRVDDRDYFRQTLATGRPFISSAFRGRGFGHDAIVAIAAPVPSPTASGWAAVVEGSLDLLRLRDVVLPIGGLPGTGALVVDTEDVVVFSSVGGVETLDPRPAEHPRTLTARSTVEGLGWTAVAQVSSSAAHEQRNRFLAATALATLLALAVGFWLARHNAVQITGPLGQLVGALRSYEAGRAHEPVRPPDAAAEVLELFDGFADLDRRLRSAHDELRSVLAGLEQQVLERTETLRESEERFRQLADNITAVFWVRSVAPSRMLYISPAYETIWERPRSELEHDALAFTASIHPDDRERALAAIARQPDAPYAQEYRIVCPTGEVKWIRSIGFRVHDPDGRVIRIAGLSEDVTEAHRIDQLRNDLTNTMVHDLRSPLTAILAGIEMAQTTDQRAEAHRRSLEAALRSAHKMVFLIDAILDVSRLESGRFPLEIADVELPPLAAEVTGGFEALAATRGVTLLLDAEEGLPAVPIDAVLVRRVLENLVGNALKFTPDGGCVRIVVKRVTAGLSVSVTDDGPGIAPELAERLFEKFVTGRRAGRGSGLGLAFCRLAVEAHGGTIALESVLGRGASFHFVLPLLRSTQAAVVDRTTGGSVSGHP